MSGFMRFCLLVLLAQLSWAFGQIVTFTQGTTSTTSIGAAANVGGFSEVGGADPGYAGPEYTFQNDVITLDTLSDGVTTYDSVLGFDRVNATVKGGASDGRLYYLRGGTPTGPATVSFTGQYKSSFAELFDTPFQINVGSDETMRTNQSLEIWNTTGVTIATASGLTNAGITIIERGANDNGFRVRAITSLDGSDNPLGKSDWVSLASGDPFGDGLFLDGDSSATEFTRDVFLDTSASPFSGPFQEFQTTGDQPIGAFLIPMDDFGLSVGQSVYGYEIDDTGNSGLDLIPAGGFLSSDPGALTVIPEPSTMMLFMAGVLGLTVYRRSTR